MEEDVFSQFWWNATDLKRDAWKNKEGFYMYLNQKREVQGDPPHLVTDAVWLVTTDKKKTEVFNNLFAMVFPDNCILQWLGKKETSHPFLKRLKGMTLETINISVTSLC